MTKNITLSEIVLILISSSLFALSFAYISQYFFDMKPCQLCIYERWPFFFILGISVFAFFLREKLQKLAIFLAMFLLFINCLLALYHVGVEKKIFRISESCTSKLENYNSIEELEKALMQEPLARCDEPQFFFLGLSMAAWNAAYCASLIMILFMLMKLRRSIPNHAVVS